METLRICRPDESHTHDHYWDIETGKRVTQPEGFNFTQEEVCPVHNKVNNNDIVVVLEF